MKRILGIDFGTKRLGLALGDPRTKVAVPMDTVELHGADPVLLVADMVERDHYDHVVVGAPMEADSRVRASVLKFAKSLEEISGVEVSLVDEHLTSKVADIIAKEHGGKEHDDALAAMLIVEELLHSIS